MGTEGSQANRTRTVHEQVWRLHRPGQSTSPRDPDLANVAPYRPAPVSVGSHENGGAQSTDIHVLDYMQKSRIASERR